jgi:hypothetical protein
MSYRYDHRLRLERRLHHRIATRLGRLSRVDVAGSSRLKLGAPHKTDKLAW